MQYSCIYITIIVPACPWTVTPYNMLTLTFLNARYFHCVISIKVMIFRWWYWSNHRRTGRIRLCHMLECVSPCNPIDPCLLSCLTSHLIVSFISPNIHSCHYACWWLSVIRRTAYWQILGVPAEAILVMLVNYWINMAAIWHCTCFVGQAFKKMINIGSDMAVCLAKMLILTQCLLKFRNICLT